MTLELVPLATATVGLRPMVSLPSTPRGTRTVAEPSSFDIDGERLRAHLYGVAAADWPVSSADGTIITLDVRATLETDDGALLYAQYSGRIDATKQPLTVYSTPQLDTGDERYDWLNRIQIVGKGTFDDAMTRIDYELFELR
jgi:hypothetical protein